MTEKVFYQDSYQKTHSTKVVRVVENGVVLESTIFYPLGGGQPGDTGSLNIGEKSYRVTDTRFDTDRISIIHFLDVEDLSHIQAGQQVDMQLDWQRRHRLMRMHTSMHLMCHLIPAQATGGSIGETESRIDFDLQGLEVEKEDLTSRINELIQRDIPLTISSITDEELDSNPSLVRTMSVQPPRGQGTVRTINIENIDYQPCGGTHVKSTGEIGEVVITKLKNKGRQNKRISLALVNP
ncbi:MAG: alanyl-tRNA editing protein [Gammaproteobacteria bacterium]|nr:alanyl-tRNA editing protein [Gammaproteobacteria bacterium]